MSPIVGVGRCGQKGTEPLLSGRGPETGAVGPGLVGQVTVDPVSDHCLAIHQPLAVGDEAAELTPLGWRLMRQGEIAVEILALNPCRVDPVGLATARLGRQGHLQDVGQEELGAWCFPKGIRLQG